MPTAIYAKALSEQALRSEPATDHIVWGWCIVNDNGFTLIPRRIRAVAMGTVENRYRKYTAHIGPHLI